MLGEPLERLKGLIEELQRGNAVLDGPFALQLNRSATELAKTCEERSLHLLREALETIGRFAFAKRNPKNERQITHALTQIAFASYRHCGSSYAFRRLASALRIQALPHTKKAVKKELIERLTSARDHLVETVVHVCVFQVDGMHLSIPEFKLGQVAFHNTEHALLRSVLADLPEAVPKFAGADKSGPAAAVVRATAHPSGGSEAIANAEEELRLVLSFIATSDPAFTPARSFPGRAYRGGSKPYTTTSPPRSKIRSFTHIDAGTAGLLQDNWTEFIAPLLEPEFDSVLSSRFRRALECIRRASFLQALGERTEAFLCCWGAFEVIFGGYESRERGKAIGRRVAPFIIDRTGTPHNKSFQVTPDDLRRFLNDGKQGKVSLDLDADELEMVETLLEDDDPRSAWTILGSSTSKSLLAWKERQVRARLEEVDEAEAREARLRGYALIRDRFRSYYKLRNDIAHGGYENEAICGRFADELLDYYYSIFLNITFNFSRVSSYDQLLYKLDQESSLSAHAEAETATSTEPGGPDAPSAAS